MSLKPNRLALNLLGLFAIVCVIAATVFTNSPAALTASAPVLPAISANPAPGFTFVVNQTGDAGDLTCDATCTLRDALDDANATPGADTITFDFAVFNTPKTITLSGGNLRITDSVNIEGSGANLLTVSGNHISRIFTVTETPVVNISGMTLTGGNGTGATTGNNFGGAIFNQGDLTINGMVITGNSAMADGGGVANSTSDTLNVINCTISNNVADADNAGSANGGGGLYNATAGQMTVTNSTISGNSVGGNADGGGGVHNSGVTTITNSTISGNSSGKDAGGIQHVQGSGASFTLTNATIVNNTAVRDGGGVWKSSVSTVHVGNTIIANNTDGGTAPDFRGTLASDGYNLIKNTIGTTITGTTTGNIIGVDPNLLPLQDNGGPTFTHALLPGSPAIDTGASGSLATDQRGFPRPFDDAAFPNAVGGNGADIGSFEVQAPPPPTPMTLSFVTPNKGGDQGVVSVTVYGARIQPGATVKLARSGEADIDGEQATASAPGTQIQATFNLIGRARGAWDVVVTNPDNSSATLPAGFTVEANVDPSLWVHISGRDTMRASHTATTYTIAYGNSGNADAFAVPLFVTGMPSTAEVDLKFPLATAPGIIDPTLPTVFDFNGQKMIPLIITKIPAGSVTYLTFTVRFTVINSDRVMRLRAAISGPLLKPVLESAASVTVERPGTRAHHTTRRSRASVTPAISGSIHFRDTPECYNSVIQAGLGCVGAAIGTQNAGLAANCAGGFISFFGGLAATFAGGQPNRIDAAQLATSAMSTIPSCAEAALGLSPVGKVLAAISCGLSLASAANSCLEWTDDLDVHLAESRDPNEKVGPRGNSNQHFISGSQPLTYSIFFENQPTATAPAQTVIVTDRLDTSKLDLSTFSIGLIGFGVQIVTPSPGLQAYDTDVDLRPDKDLIVRIHAALDTQTGVVAWQFQSIDPDTNQPTTDPLAGFLPPDTDGIVGQGSVLFSVMPKPGLSAGTEIKNQAQIIFDLNAPMDTNTFTNIIDDSRPSSQVTALADSQCGSFNVSWSGTDTGAGIANYSIFVSDNGGPFTEWQFNTNATSASFPGTAGHTYGFYSVARDGAGNTEDAPPNADAVTNGIAGSTYYRDADGDGHGDAQNSTQACSVPAGYVTGADDCDDTRANVFPGAPEVCDGLDNDCDGQTDEGVTTTFYRDADGDGYGNSLLTTQACSAPAGYVTNNGDCNDADSLIHAPVTYYRDVDGDGFGNPNNSTSACASAPPAGYVTNNKDCDDTKLLYRDLDGDGFGAGAPVACGVATNTDCNDSVTAVHPGAVELLNGIDDNCNGSVDEGLTINDKIVFESLRNGNLDVYVMNADGTNQMRLTTNAAADGNPAWSPDHSKIVFTSLRNGNLEIYVMNADGSNQTRLTNNSAIDDEPSWSPDGTRIAFCSSRDGNPEIYVMNANGTGQTRLTNNFAWDTEPEWSPDGSRIAFTSNRASVLNFEIYVMNANGSNVVRLTTHNALDHSPDWSPDGTKIVFASNRGGLLDFEVWVMNANGSSPARLTNTSRASVRPAWSRDGSKITFATNRDGLLNFEIYSMNANGGNQQRLTNNSAVDSAPNW